MINLQRILAPVDFSQSASIALSHCSALAEKYGAELHLLHVVPQHVLPWFHRPERLCLAKEDLEQVAISSSKVKVCREIRQGSLPDSVLEYAREADIDLVVFDRQATAALTQRVFKSVVNRLLDELACPLLVISAQDEEPESAVLGRATQVLRDQFGDAMAGDHKAIRLQLQEALTRELSLSPQDADSLFARLEAAGVIVWQPDSGQSGDPQASPAGSWQIRPLPDEQVQFDIATDEPGREMSAAVNLLQRAIAARATDVHIDPGPGAHYVVRFRIDGRMHEYCRMQGDVCASMMKQLKLLANVSLADPFLPAESRLQLPESIGDHEVRITTTPVADGQAIALRLIDRDKLHRPLNQLGLSANSFATIYQMLHQRSGLVLVSGPTGAGKTTTAYSILNVLFTDQQNIISLEDPVELLVPFMRQLNVDQRHGFTMKVGLSTLLRMDPDVVFVGEIRDAEAAHVAIQAASCGKRVFSTMHMRDVSTTLTAMRELGIDAKIVADDLTGVITQRLVRRLCTSCSQSSPVTKHEQNLFASQDIDSPAEVARPRGCADCSGTGYKDRTGIFEAVAVDGDIADAVRQEKSEAELREIIRVAGIPSLMADGLLKVREGITSIQDVLDISWLSGSLPVPQPHVATDEIYERGVLVRRDSSERMSTGLAQEFDEQ